MDIKAQQLGMPYGTASNKLKKQILFMLLVELNKNYCFQCKEEIVSENDLSIEHKQPWLHISKELFWDLNNIAFSHLHCNVRAARSANKAKTHCINGHELVGVNLKPSNNGWRQCRECQRNLQRSRII